MPNVTIASGGSPDRRLPAAVQLAQRVLLAVGGSYAAVTAAVPLLAAALTAFGLGRPSAVTLGTMLGIAGYVCAVLWAFAERRPSRLWLVLGGGALLGHGLVWALARLAPVGG